jgi:uncharacterized protein YndB with AHSA1/START domain
MVNISTTDDAILGDIEIAAKPETVFSALTDPAQASQWWGDSKTYKADQWEIDLRVGGKWHSRGKSANGEAFEVQGKYLKIDPPRLLEYTWLSSFGGNAISVVRWELQPSSAGTRLTLTRSGLKEHPQIKAMYSGGWPSVMGWLKGFAEKKAA